MKTRATLFSIILLIAVNCTTKQELATDQLSGVYVREYSLSVTNPATGAAIGTRTIRDTITVRRTGDAYEVSNSKWKLNEYENDGWRSMEHDDDRPIPVQIITLDPSGQILSKDATPILYLNLESHTISKSPNGELPFSKIEP